MKQLLKILLFTILLSCNFSESKKKVLNSQDTETVESKLPFSKYVELEAKIASNQLQLDTLITQTTDTILRIWTRYEATNGGQVSTFKKKNGKFTKNLIRFIMSYNNLSNTPTQTDYLNALEVKAITNTTVELINFRNSIVRDLKKLGLYDLKNQDANPKWKNKVSDGLTYSIDYRDSQTKKFVTYNCPDIYQSDFTDNQNVVQILLNIDSIYGLEIDGGIHCKK